MFRIVLTRYKNKIFFSYQEDDKTLELRLFNDNAAPVGTVYCGRVSDVVRNIGASFVDLGNKTKGFLPNIDHKQGEIIPVQIVKSGTDIKEARLSEDISIAGEYSVVYMKEGEFKPSSKLNSKIRKDLINKLNQTFASNHHFTIIRTNAASCDFDLLVNEIKSLEEKIKQIEYNVNYRTKSEIYKPDAEWLVAVKGIYREYLDEIVTDDKEIYEKLLCIDGVNIRFYDDKLLPLIKLYSLETRLKEATSKKVWLKCGGFLFIEPTEALVSIDVNSGKVNTSSDKEETVLKVNLEAACEVARQLRLRNLSGIIVVDFINMKKASNDAILLKTLRELVESDPVKTQVHGMTGLGLVEITRTKGNMTLYEQSRSVSDDATILGD